MHEINQTQKLIQTFAPKASLALDVQGTTSFKTALVLAPMAGVSGPAYRLLNRLGGAEAAYSEMISCAGILHASKKSKRLMTPHPLEGGLYIQLFGAHSEQFVQALSCVKETTGDALLGVDINMACPVKKIVSKGEGAALLEDRSKAFSIVEAVRTHLGEHIPVSVKLRIGIDADHPVDLSFYQGLYEAGANELIIHGRFAKEFYKGSSRINIVHSIAEKLQRPVALTGDMLSVQSIKEQVDSGIFSKVLLARGSYGNPWLAQDVRAKMPLAHSLSQKLNALSLLIHFMELFEPEMGRARMYASHFLKGFPDAPYYRNLAMQCRAPHDYYELIARIQESYA